MMDRRSVYIAYTGGTIGMARTPDGFAPKPGLLRELLENVPELDHRHNPSAPHWHLEEYPELIDSSNLTPDKWIQIADDLERNFSKYDGFVVVHGTDTLAYTSSALSFFIEGVSKPVVVTGSQIPMVEPRTDARNNLMTAITLAAGHPELTAVCVAFGSKVMRGNRVTKVSAFDFDAFDSPRYPSIGRVGVGIRIDRRRIPRPEIGGFRFLGNVAAQGSVAAIRLFPGFDPGIIERVTQGPLRALVLEVYGSGNGPDKDTRFLDAIRDATKRDRVIVCVAQPLVGAVEFGTYAAGSALARAGAVSGHDMTTEAALTKLHYLISRGLDPRQLKREVGRNMRGEMSSR